MLPKAYDPQATEDRIYQMWEETGAFVADRDSGKETFTVAMPPPNATGQLHLGHAVMLALEDIFIRFQRARGKEALWVPGTDHAAIATNAIMERKLAEEGTDKHAVGREEFLKRLKKFVEGSQDTIRSQVRKMGASCDWSRERYTMDASLSRCVNEVFTKMYGDGLIYRGNRIVNWCPHCHSTLSDDEVVYKEEDEVFYTIKYGPLEIGTVRPETKFGDTAVCVHPDDDRYKEYVGQELEIETVIGKATVKVVADAIADPNFGTGALKVTPAHDFKDFDLAKRHDLPVVQVIDEDGRMMDKAGPFKGMTTLECRRAMVDAMKEKGILVKEEPYRHNVSVCYRCKHVVEPLPSLQWFIDVNKKVVPWDGKKMSLKEVMQDTVRSGKITLIPERFEKTYFHWIDNLRDWCVSRQIWWGHRVPVWYKEDEIFVGANAPEGDDWKQDNDTLDTWFSSALWTWSTLVDPEAAADPSLSLEDILKRSPDYQNFHPTQVMETGYDILFFWVARMILMTTYATGTIPFDTVYLHGLIRTREGKKMSKSDPETCIDPLEIIPQYGADALRLSMIVGQSPGNDSRLYDEKIAGYRNFINKLWNASRFVLLQCEAAKIDPNTVGAPEATSLADRAILSSLQTLVTDVTEGLSAYRLSDVGERLYSFVWDEFCDWYLELSKGEANPAVLVHALRTILRLLHPYCPFVTEELWSHVSAEGSGILLKEEWPVAEEKLQDSAAEEELRTVVAVVTAIRKMRTDHGIEPGTKVDVIIHASDQHLELLRSQREHILRLARIRDWTLDTVPVPHEHAASAFLKDVEVHLPLEGVIDLAKERERLTAEKENLEGFLKSVQAKLDNAKFVESAPAEVVQKEREKAARAEEKLKKLEERLQAIL